MIPFFQENLGLQTMVGNQQSINSAGKSKH